MELEHAKELVDNFHLKYSSKLGPLRLWNTSILFLRLRFFHSLCFKKKKNLMMISFYIQFGVQFPLHWFTYLYSALQFLLQSDTCIQKQSPLQNLHTYISPQCKRTSRVVLSEFWGSVLLMAQWQIIYCTPIIPDFSCLCHAVWCLLLVVLGHSMIIGWLLWCCVPDYLV